MASTLMEKNMENEHLKLLNIDQTCEHLNIGRCSVYKLIKQEQLKTIKIGKRRLVTMEAIRSFIGTLEADGGAIET